MGGPSARATRRRRQEEQVGVETAENTRRQESKRGKSRMTEGRAPVAERKRVEIERCVATADHTLKRIILLVVKLAQTNKVSNASSTTPSVDEKQDQRDPTPRAAPPRCIHRRCSSSCVVSFLPLPAPSWLYLTDHCSRTDLLSSCSSPRHQRDEPSRSTGDWDRSCAMGAAQRPLPSSL